MKQYIEEEEEEEEKGIFSKVVCIWVSENVCCIKEHNHGIFLWNQQDDDEASLQRGSTTRGLARKPIASASGNSLTRRFACLSRFVPSVLELVRLISRLFFVFFFLLFIYIFGRSTFNVGMSG